MNDSRETTTYLLGSYRLMHGEPFQLLCVGLMLGMVGMLIGCQKSKTSSSASPISKVSSNKLDSAHANPGSVTASELDTPSLASGNLTSTIYYGDEISAETTAEEDLKKSNWLMFRGNPKATGVATGKLTPKMKTAWEFKVKNGGYDGSPVIHEGIVYVGEGRGILFALDLKDGKQLWQFPKEDSEEKLLGFMASPAIRDGLIYIGDLNGFLHCIDKTGQRKWKFETESALTSSVNFYKDNVIIGGEDARIYCLDAKTGKKKWQFEAADQIQCMPTVGDGKAFVTGCDGSLHVVDLETGKEGKAVELESPTIASPAVLGERVYFGTAQRGFLAVDHKKGEISWDHADTGLIYSSPAIIEHKDVKHVIYGSRERKVISLNADDGSVNWECPTDRDIDASPVVVGQYVVAVSTGGKIFLIELATGKKVFEKQFSGGFAATPAVAGKRVVIATGRGTVYCLVSE